MRKLIHELRQNGLNESAPKVLNAKVRPCPPVKAVKVQCTVDIEYNIYINISNTNSCMYLQFIFK